MESRVRVPGRFADTFLEPIWNRHQVASVQITMAEDFGVAGRGAFYEEVGAIRDVVQNHLLQLIALGARVKAAGETRGEQVELCLAHHHPTEMEPYERLLGDAMRGDPTLFAREDSVEAAWAVVEHVLRADTPTHEYRPGSCGPRQANSLVRDWGGWHIPGPGCGDETLA